MPFDGDNGLVWGTVSATAHVYLAGEIIFPYPPVSIHSELIQFITYTPDSYSHKH